LNRKVQRVLLDVDDITRRAERQAWLLAGNTPAASGVVAFDNEAAAVSEGAFNLKIKAVVSSAFAVRVVPRGNVAAVVNAGNDKQGLTFAASAQGSVKGQLIARL
jgi:hypothetical protein